MMVMVVMKVIELDVHGWEWLFHELHLISKMQHFPV